MLCVFAGDQCAKWLREGEKQLWDSSTLRRFAGAIRRAGPFSARIKVVHNGVMRTETKMVRQSVSLPVKVATQVRTMAKSRRLSATRMLVELIENGIEAEQRKQQAFFDLAERFRSETDPEAAKRLGDELGQMVFGG